MRNKLLGFAIVFLLSTASQAGGLGGLYDFDLVKNLKDITSVDIIIFDGYPRYDHLGSIVKKETFVLYHIRGKVKETKRNIDWQAESFNKLMKEYDPKYKRNYNCFCPAKYTFALVFYIKHHGKKRKAAVC